MHAGITGVDLQKKKSQKEEKSRGNVGVKATGREREAMDHLRSYAQHGCTRPAEAHPHLLGLGASAIFPRCVH